MIKTILILVGGIKGVIVAIGSIAGGLWLLLLKRRLNRQQETIEQQDRAIMTHEAKETVHRQDQVLSAEADRRIDALRERVHMAANHEEAADAISGGLNGYFGGEK